MLSNSFNLVEITDLNDDLLLPWLDLYETTFPPNERELVSSKLSLLKTNVGKNEKKEIMLVATNEQKSLIGIINYEFNEELSVAILWYFAIKEGLQSKGLGSQMYREFTSQLVLRGIQTLFFEIEIPEKVETKEKRQLAERRIEFYRRLNAKLLTGVRYMQHVGSHQPPTPMHIMVYSLQPLDAQIAYDLAKAIFEDNIEQIDSLALN